MTDTVTIKSLVLFIFCYLIGSIPVAYIFVKLKTQKDITREGSGNVGTLNSFTVTKSKWIGISVLILDLLKGLLPVYTMLFVAQIYYPVVMLGACGLILGHNFPVWLKFKGGRGLAPGAGIFFIVNYFIVLGWCVVWLGAFLFKRKVLIANTAATFSLPVLVGLVNFFPWMVVNRMAEGYSDFYFTAFSIIITIIILFRHKEVFKEISTKITVKMFPNLKNPVFTDIDDLNEMARQIRRDIINMLLISKSGHSGGPLGLADLFTALYFNKLNILPEKPGMDERDYVFLSIGHVAPVWYATLARRGYIPLDELKTLRKVNGRLQGHPAPFKTHGVPGVEIASGALGQGLSIAVGAALGLRLSGKSNHVYCICGDGELNEGQIWEAAMTAAHYNLDNLTVIVDRNHCQIDNRTENVMRLEPLVDKWKAFGFEVSEIDGHDMKAVLTSIDDAKKIKGKPTCIMLYTKMGRGVSFMEDSYKWHGVPPNDEQGKVALNELNPTKFGDFVDYYNK